MSIINITLFLIIFIFVVPSCKAKNENYERMHRLAESIKKTPADNADWLKLIDYSNSRELWDRNYAYQFLVTLAPSQNEKRKLEMVKIFKCGLSDSDYGIRKLSAQGSEALGNLGVNSNAPELIKILALTKEDDISWMIAEMLGDVTDLEMAKKSFEVLIKAVKSKPPLGYPKEAPQLRLMALESALKLAKRGLIDKPEQQFYNLRDSVDDVFLKPRIDEAINVILNK